MNVDGVIFDVDGVLVDVRASFLAAARATVDLVVRRRKALRGRAALVDDAVIAAYKAAGGYNNDWDLAYALACWHLASARPEHRTAADVRRAAGRARDAARRPIAELEALIPKAWRPTREEVTGLMLELYWGSREAARRFGILPRLDHEDPYQLRERVLLRADTVDALRASGVRRFGVLTGRLAVEWDAVRARVPLADDVPTVTAEDGSKPDPGLLGRLVGRMGVARPCYVGDVMDDWQLVVAYNATPSGRAAPAAAVLVCDGAMRRELRRAGASLFLSDVNELPTLLSRARAAEG